MKARLDLLAGTRGRLLCFCLLYLSEGVAYGFSATAMVAFMRTEGLSLSQIGAFSAALLIPWSFKWAWAPIVDLVKLHRFGGRRAWIALCTAMMIVTLITVALIDFRTNFRLLLAMIVLNNLFCATQDVAIDSLAVRTLRENELARGNGFMFGGQYAGIALGGGGAIFVFGQWGLSAALWYVSAMLFASLAFVLIFIRDPDVAPTSRRPLRDTLSDIAGSFLAFLRELYRSFLKSGSGPRVGLVFALVPTGAMAMAYAMLGTMKVDYGLSQTQIATLSVYNTIAGAIGCMVGGWFGDRFGIRRLLGVFFVLSAVPTLALASQISAHGLAQIALPLFYGLTISHGLVFGMGYGVHKAVFMGMTNPAVAATQFTTFMAMGNLAISYTNFWQGHVAERFGYATVLYVDALIVLVPLALLPFVGGRQTDEVPALETALLQTD